MGAAPDNPSPDTLGVWVVPPEDWTLPEPIGYLVEATREFVRQTSGVGFYECHNDVHGSGTYYLAAQDDPLDDERSVQRGTCGTAAWWERSTPALLEFRTAGDFFGHVLLEGYDSEGNHGWYKISCKPAASAYATGVEDDYWAVMQLDNSDCVIRAAGPQPPEFVVWRAAVTNENWNVGSAYAAVRTRTPDPQWE